MVSNIQTIRKKILPILKKNHVKKASLFGSCVRGDQKKTSDIDILIEAPKGIGLEFVELKLALEESLGKRVDLLTYKSLHPYLKKSILENEVRIL